MSEVSDGRLFNHLVLKRLDDAFAKLVVVDASPRLEACFRLTKKVEEAAVETLS